MGLFQRSEIENEEQLIKVCQRGLCISCIILLHYRKQLHVQIPSFSNVLSQAVICPGQDLAGRVEKEWVNGRKQVLLATGEKVPLDHPYKEVNCSWENTRFFQEDVYPYNPLVFLQKLKKYISIGSLVPFKQDNPIQSFRQRPSEKIKEETPDQESLCSP